MDRQSNLSNENINTGVSVAFKTKRELECQTKLFSGNTSFYVSLREFLTGRLTIHI